jgi:cytochrome o ubiquinol oxidase subunit 3
MIQQHKDMSKASTGFWIYLMTDCVLFASLFATYAVLKNGVWDGPSGAEIFNLPYVWVMTILLLSSSFTCGLALLAAKNKNRLRTLWLLVLTGTFGFSFLGMEFFEFFTLINEGNGWQRSGFLSAFFVLVGMHGLHITAGLIWLVYLMCRIGMRGFTDQSMRRLSLFGYFWHFLDIIWIFIFTIVYLMGVGNI